MEVISYSDAKRNLAKILDKVTEDKAPLIITRKNGEAVVLIPYTEFRTLEETAHLLSSPENALRLAQSIMNVSTKCILKIWNTSFK